jgi:hypothetical protein
MTPVCGACEAALAALAAPQAGFSVERNVEVQIQARGALALLLIHGRGIHRGRLHEDRPRPLDINWTLADDDGSLVHIMVLVAMVVARFLMAPVIMIAVVLVIVGLGSAGGGEEEKTGAEGGADEMAETH